MLMLRRRLAVTVVALGALAVSGVAAVAQDGETAPGQGVAQVTSIDPEARDAMAMLDSTRTATDALPAAVARPLDENADFGMNPDLSRLAIGNATRSVYVIPADGHVCAALASGDSTNLSCPETAQVADGTSGATTVTVDGGSIAIYGIVPDGVSTVTVKTGTSTSTAVGVDHNAYYTVVPGGTALRSVSYTGPSGEVEFPIYDPSLAFEN
jgi:hypothetical protein